MKHLWSPWRMEYLEGNKKEVVKRKKIEEYQDDQETTVTNNKSTTVGETHNELNLGDKYTSVKKVSNMWTEGDVEFISDNNIHFSTKKKCLSPPTHSI